MNPGMRPKVTGDTFFLPDPEGAVYFRNNGGSFRMEGSMIDRWIEKLIPVFNGEHTLAELTGGLPEAHRDRVYEIAATLMDNGFVRDMSQELPHQLEGRVLGKFISQIDFLDSFGGSGARRFQTYREAKVLAAGSGSMLLALVSALLESGLPRFAIRAGEGLPTDRKRIAELAVYARLTDPEVRIEETAGEKGNTRWQEAVEPFDWILYAAHENEVEELRSLHAACRELGKKLLPAIAVGQTGLAGPLVMPESEGCWESAWRRLHRPAVMKDPGQHFLSSTAEAMLANVAAFELMKAVTGVAAQELTNQVFLLNLETLEGSRHPFLPHPWRMGRLYLEWEEMTDESFLQESRAVESDALFHFFNRLTSTATGVFHHWDEGDTLQLPLSQCLVQAADPSSGGPADLLDEQVCGGFTHEEARREAGLAGIESYAEQWVKDQETMGVGAGATEAEAVSRGLLHYIKAELGMRYGNKPPEERAQNAPKALDDERSAYYLRSLITMGLEPFLCAGEPVFGFPVVWAGCGDSWYAGVGGDRTSAERDALMQVLLAAQNEKTGFAGIAVVPAVQVADYREFAATGVRRLRQQGFRLLVCDLAVEPFMREHLAGVFGVAVRKEESA